MTEDAVSVTRLFPVPNESRPLPGLYLAHWPELRGSGDAPCVYADFIASLDGRISEVDPDSGRHRVPRALANPRDWRLYMELLAQADVVLTSDRHLRAVAAGRHADLLTLAEREYPDLVSWREDHGLAPHPACAAISVSLDIPFADLRERHPAPIIAITRRDASASRVASARAAGAEVVIVDAQRYVDGGQVVGALAQRGFRRIFVIAGPRVLHTLLAADCLTRLYLTLVPMMLAGASYDSLTKGPTLVPPRQVALRELYLDSAALAGRGQWFACFDVSPWHEAEA